MANFGDINSNLTLGASQAVRRNAANNGWEAVTLTIDGLLPAQSGNSGKFLTTNGSAASWATIATGITIGSTPITSGANDRVLYQASGVVSQSGNFTYDSATLKVQAANSSQTANIFEAIRYDGAVGLRVDDDTSVTLGAVYDYANAKHAPQHIFQYVSGGAYSGKGIKIADVGSGAIVRLHANAYGLYLTDDAGSAASMLLGTRVNPGDASTFIAQSSFWWINSGIFSVGTSSLQGHGQIESFSTSIAQFAGHYDASNYFKVTVASNGATTFDAIGSGAKFIFSDKVSARIEPRVRTQTDVATLTPNADSYDVDTLSAQNQNLTINNPSGTPTNGQVMTFLITSAGIGGDTLTFGGGYLGTAAYPLPSATLAGGNSMFMEFQYFAVGWILVNYQEV